MPRPYEFATEDELVRRLADSSTASAAMNFYAQRSLNIRSVVETGVTGNTFRAFRNLSVRPSVAFRAWAVSYIESTQDELKVISEMHSYALYVHSATEDLCSYWGKTTGTEIGYGRAAKLLNLVLKKFVCLSSLSEDQRSTLISLQHVPLDSYTIIGLRSVAPDLSISRGATMKFIEDRRQYDLFQAIIRAITEKAGVPPIYYEVLAWDMGH